MVGGDGIAVRGAHGRHSGALAEEASHRRPLLEDGAVSGGRLGQGLRQEAGVHVVPLRRVGGPQSAVCQGGLQAAKGAALHPLQVQTQPPLPAGHSAQRLRLLLRPGR